MVFLNEKKNSTTAILFCLFLGGIGAHHFYLGNNGVGIVYALFFWTSIPMIISLFELFVVGNRVRTYNQNLALRISQYVAR